MHKRNRIMIIATAVLLAAGLAVVVVTTTHSSAKAKGHAIVESTPTTLPGFTHGDVDLLPDGTTTTTAKPGTRGAGRSGTSTTTSTTGRPTPAPETCRNSTDPACGDFRWDPDPGPNAPLTADVRITPAHPAVGQKVTFTISAHDPDASRGGLGGWGFGDGPNVAVTGLYPGGCDRHGPWSPPARTPSTWEETLTNTYRHAGTFRASFIVRSATPGIAGCPDPYASGGTAEIVVNVSDHATQDSDNQAGFTCEHGGSSLSATHITEGEETPPLLFYVHGGCPHGDVSQAGLSADVTNRTDQTVFFPGGIDAVVHLAHNGAVQDVHVTDPGTTRLAPGQHVHLSRPISADPTGGYGVTGTISYGF